MNSSSEGFALSGIDRKTPAQVLVVCYILLAIGNSLVMTSVPRRLLVGVGVVLLVYEALGFRSMKYQQYFLYVLGLWIAAALTLNGVLFGEWVQESVYLPGNLGVALALCRGHVGRRTTAILFYGASAYFAYRLLSVRSPAAIHLILVTGSANGISSFIISLCCLHYAVVREEGAPIRLLPAITCLFVSALTLGRSGMAAGTLLLVGVALHDLARERNARKLAVKLALYGGISVGVLVLVLPRLEAISFIFERFSEFGLASDARARIWATYGQTLDGMGVLTGHGRGEIFAGFTNVHNSFILWHKSMGVMAVPLYLIAIAALLVALARDWMWFVLLAVLLLRAFFDEMILPFRLFDFLFFYLACTALVALPPRRYQVLLPRPAEA
jgi:hypothetical protein